jgi:transposase
MSTYYSLDLRERMVAAYEKSHHKSHVCETFSIARSTLDKWLTLREETGNLQLCEHRPVGHSYKVTDIEAFRQWAEGESPFERIEDLRPRFEVHYGKSISYHGLHKWLQRIGWSHKKNAHPTSKPNH